MKRSAAALTLLLAAAPAFGAPKPAKAKPQDVNARVEDLLKRMTLEEKVGQMTQLTLGCFMKEQAGPDGAHLLDEERLEQAVAGKALGSILNVGNNYAYDLKRWHALVTKIQDLALKKTRLGIPVLYGIDSIHGATYVRGATLFPQQLAQAAARDVSMARRIGEVCALETRAAGLPWNFSPVLDVGRQPLWPRLWETYGEDPTLASALGASYVRGLQGDAFNDAPFPSDRVAACMKHYVGYSFPFTGKDRTPALLDERSLREFFLPPFEAAVSVGAPTVMVNSAEISGIPGHANGYLINGVLKTELKFEGFAVSDWEDIIRLHKRDRVAETPKEAVRMAVMAGVDMSMVPSDLSFYDLLLELAKEGAVPESRLDDAVRRILKVKMRLGLFENPYPDPKLASRVASKEATELNLRAAQESLTLLKNEGGLLPLKKNAKVLVAGPTADLLSVLNGGWTITWQGSEEERYPKEKLTLLEAVQAKLGAANVTYVQGSTFTAEVDIPAAVEAAQAADAVILALGEEPYTETPGNIDDLTLDEPQLKLAEELAKTGKPVVLVLIEGRPRIIRRIEGKMQAIVMAYLPGMEGGRALADVLFGDANPSGKLPITYPRWPNALTLYDRKPLEDADGNGYAPQFPFGHGLSYTTFQYSGLALDKASPNENEVLGVSVKVTNTGTRAGKEAVELYLTDLYGSVSRPVKQLKRFTKVLLAPGETKRVEFTLSRQDYSFIGRTNQRVVEPGRFRAAIADQSAEFELQRDLR